MKSRAAEPDFIKPQNVVELRTMGDAIALLDQWQEAEATAYRAYVQTNHKLGQAQFMVDYYRFLANSYRLLFLKALDPANDDIRHILLQQELDAEACGVDG